MGSHLDFWCTNTAYYRGVNRPIAWTDSVDVLTMSMVFFRSWLVPRWVNRGSARYVSLLPYEIEKVGGESGPECNVYIQTDTEPIYTQVQDRLWKSEWGRTTRAPWEARHFSPYLSYELRVKGGRHDDDTHDAPPCRPVHVPVVKPSNVAWFPAAELPGKKNPKKKDVLGSVLFDS